ncbi:MAG: translation initiation factor IF-2 [Jaaginema sp. PMC 1079.18]|nr:translation initiation factor IF-2 [Jaaginema sp. PMC 1080.18]MEC4852212.1 translation initiation factor IF-2 [Jaaginema sp. PMC 1079.18]MEC4864498.1 translation initiation factor IF-2 [Jaaginema sp. PMC 1078.18]
MNNGKTRIYELSKELNRENKDILEICKELNIEVKSHSSTIADEAVERIRATVKRQGPRERPNRSHPDNNRPKGPRKPQIREILKSSPGQESSNGQSQPNSESASAANLTPPPQPPAKPKLKSPAAPEAVATDKVPTLNAPKPPQAQTEDESLAESGQETPVLSETATPELLTPPPRPASKSPSQPGSSGSKPTLSEAPVLKKPKKKIKTSSGKTVDRGSQDEGDRPQSPKIEKAPRLSKPKLNPPPSKPDSEVDSSDDTIDESDNTEEATLLEPPSRPQKLKRPAALRQAPKHTPEWEEEDDEIRSGKAAKSTKTSKSTKKRRSQLIVEDDDDELDESLNSNSGNAQNISLSIARPPKPSAMTRPSQPSKPSKTKKPTKVDPAAAKSSNDSRDRRREKEVEESALPESIELPDNLTVQELASLLNIAETEIIRKLFFKGIAVNITQTIDRGTAQLIAEDLGVRVETPELKSAAAKTTEMLEEGDLESLQRRPPVVTIMGHVDHGKTTLLDSIRKTKVAQGEAGGITQHIGAYHVDVEHEDRTEQVVFLDTPGHEAFTAMRARGTRVTDIAILVVAADDGVQPQTKEAISHARAAGVPLIVAINKIDKPEAEPDRIKQELTEQGLVPEEWGGETIMVPVSAIQGENLDQLLEMILLVAEVEELEANPNRTARGTVIEAHLDKARGPVASLLVQNGTLNVGDILVAGSSFGKIRAMIDDRGNRVEVATPSFAAEVLGLNDVPNAGDEFDVYANEKEARAIADQRAAEQRQSRLQRAVSSRRVSLSSLSAQAQEGELKELNLVIKADVQGSLEAILAALKQLPQKEVQIRVLSSAPGEVTEADVNLAAASGAVVVGFNTALASGSQAAADQEGVDIREYNIIYNLLDDIQAAMEGLLEPEEVEEALGTAEVRAVIAVSKGSVAGCYVQSGKVVRNRFVRVKRGEETLYQGTLDSLKRFKEDVREVKAGFECGIGTSKFNDWQEGDIIEAYQMVLQRRTLST